VTAPDELGELRALAADAGRRAGLTIEVRESDFRIGGRPQRGFFDVAVPGVMVTGPLSFVRAWDEINEIEHGDAAAAYQAPISMPVQPPPIPPAPPAQPAQPVSKSRTKTAGRRRRWIGGAR
jgi:hypothetical protein